MSVLDDARYGVRSLAKNPAFAAVAITTLALGIGANTALFSVVNAVLLRPLPYDHPERIAAVWRTMPGSAEQPHSAGDFLDLQRASRSFERIAAYRSLSFDLVTGAGEPQRLKGAEVTSAFFDVFGVPAALGRTLRASADRPGERRVVLSHKAWQEAFGADPTVVGRSFRFGAVPMQVIGVTPPRFAWPPDVDAWVLADRVVPSSPIDIPGRPEEHRALSYLEVVARLRSQSSWVEARAELDGIARRLAETFPDNNEDRGYRIVPMHEQLTAPVRRSLLTLLGVVGLVLLIACANVASLQLARGLDRRRELAVRTSLGAAPADLVRQLLSESVMLSLAGGLLGLAVADQGTRLLLGLLPAELPRAADVALDGQVLLFTLAVSIVTGIVFGLAPALEAARVQPIEALQAGGRSSTASSRRLRASLVAGEIAVALVVLSGAGLLLRSLVRLQNVDPGFQTQSVVTTWLPLPATRYPSAAAQARLYGDVVARLEESGRYSAAAGYPPPFGSGAGSSAPVRRENETASDADSMTLFATVTPSYFKVLGIPLRRGRLFTEADDAEAPGVVMISQAAASRFWPGEDPLGQRITLGSDTLFSVVGIVGDVRRKGLDQPAEPMVYLCYRQFALPSFNVFARGAELRTLASDIRAAVRALDPELPLSAIETVGDLRARSVAQPRFRTALLALFASLALLLAAVGLYGVASDGVSRRQREIGIRMALGARPGQVLRLVLRDGLRLSAWGWIVGLLASLALGRLLASFLFDVAATDPLTLMAVSLSLFLVAAVASYMPARRAAALDPAEVIRAE